MELGPKPVLAGLVLDSISGPDVRILSLHQRGMDESEAAFAAIGNAYVRGLPIDWNSVFPTGRRIRLPTYAWDRDVSAVRHQPQRVTSPSADTRKHLSVAPPASNAAAIQRILGDVSGLPASTTLAAAGVDSLGLTTLRSTLLSWIGGKELARGLRLETPLFELNAIIRRAEASSSPGPRFDITEVRAAFDTADWVTVTHPSVNKLSMSNVLLARAAMTQLLDGEVGVAEMRHDQTHPFFYERPIDHVPGMYLIEAARQFVNWITFTKHGPLESDGTLDKVDAQFVEYVEHDAPVLLIAAFDLEFGSHEIRVIQFDRIKAIVTVEGRRIESGVYKKIRAAARRDSAA